MNERMDKITDSTCDSCDDSWLLVTLDTLVTDRQTNKQTTLSLELFSWRKKTFNWKLSIQLNNSLSVRVVSFRDGMITWQSKVVGSLPIVKLGSWSKVNISKISRTKEEARADAIIQMHHHHSKGAWGANCQKGLLGVRVFSRTYARSSLTLKKVHLSIIWTFQLPIWLYHSIEHQK